MNRAYKISDILRHILWDVLFIRTSKSNFGRQIKSYNMDKKQKQNATLCRISRMAWISRALRYTRRYPSQHTQIAAIRLCSGLHAFRFRVTRPWLCQFYERRPSSPLIRSKSSALGQIIPWCLTSNSRGWRHREHAYSAGCIASIMGVKIAHASVASMSAYSLPRVFTSAVSVCWW